MIVLAGDIGGTNSRLALYEAGGGGTAAFERTYPSAAYTGLEVIAEKYLAEARAQAPAAQAPERACFGIAGPV